MRTEKQTAASRANLAKYRENHPEGASFRHGARSRPYRKQFSDTRTTQGMRLRDTLEGLKAEFGPLTTAQSILLDRIKEKLISAECLGVYLDRQMNAVVTEAGELAPCAKQALTLSESLRKDIELLRELAAKRPAPTLAAYLNGKGGKP